MRKQYEFSNQSGPGGVARYMIEQAPKYENNTAIIGWTNTNVAFRWISRIPEERKKTSRKPWTFEAVTMS